MSRKRKNGEGTARLRKDGRWEGRVVVGYDDKGLPKTKNVLAKTKGECVEKLTALKATITPAVPTKAKADMPFGAWIEFWYEHYCKPNTRPNTQISYDGYIQRYILPKLGEIPLNKLTQSDLQQFYVWMKTDGRTSHRETKGAGLSDSMLRNCHSLCYRALEKAKAEKLITQNPAIGCKLPPMQRKEMQILSREEMQRLLIQAKAEGYYEIFLLELSTGLRQGELLALQWDDLNFTTGELRIDKQLSRTGGVAAPKTKAAVRTIILPPSVLNALKKHRDAVNSKWLFPSNKIEDAPLAASTVRQKLRLILERAGCKQVRFHDLRHVFATNALKHGMDIKTLSTIIGHVSSSTTLNVYAHVTDDMRQQAAVSIDRGIGKAAPQEAAPQETIRTMTDFSRSEGKTADAGQDISDR
jgi:integrase